VKHLAAKGLKPRPIEDREYRLKAFFPDQALVLGDLTRATCAAYYEALRARVSERTRRAYSVGAHRAMLAEARMLMRFAIGRRWLKVSPVDGVEGLGKRRHGKAQLRIDEARRWTATAIGWPTTATSGQSSPWWRCAGDARERDRLARRAGSRRRGPAALDPRLQDGGGQAHAAHPRGAPALPRAAGGQSGGRRAIFGSHDRDWPRACVQRICKLAGVPVVGAHSMRGLHATLAMDAGITGTVVAASLGHEHVSTTTRSYAKGEAVAGAQQRRALRVLAGGAGSRRRARRARRGFGRSSWLNTSPGRRVGKRALD